MTFTIILNSNRNFVLIRVVDVHYIIILLFISGLIAIFEFDLKQIIAFSTLTLSTISQISFIFIILCLSKIEI